MRMQQFASCLLKKDYEKLHCDGMEGRNGVRGCWRHAECNNLHHVF